MTLQSVWYDTNGRVKCVEDGESQATLPENFKALAETDDVGEITLDHVVTVSDGQVTGATLDPPVPPLSEKKRLALGEVRQQARSHIEQPPTDPDKWPDFRQRNADAGIYPASVKEQKDKDIAATIAESNRVEILIDDAPTHQDVKDALDSISFPTFPVA